MSKQELRDLRVRSEEDLEGLDEADIRWLLERDRIPTELKNVDTIVKGFSDLHEESVPMSQRANTGDVRSMSTDELERELERRRAEAQENPNRAGDDPHFADEDDEDEESSSRPAKKAAAKKAPAAKRAAPRSSASDDDDDDEDDEDED